MKFQPLTVVLAITAISASLVAQSGPPMGGPGGPGGPGRQGGPGMGVRGGPGMWLNHPAVQQEL
jgi:hypothetical protein